MIVVQVIHRAMSANDSNRRDRKRLRTLNHLATVAEQLFTRHGFEAVTMEQIAEAADVAKGTLYNHFTSKDAVLVYAIHHQLAHDLQTLTSRLTTDSGFVTGIASLMDALSKWCETHREYLAPYLRFRFTDIQAPTPDTGASGPNDIVDVYTRLIENSQRSGELRGDLDARHLAVLFHHLSLGALLRWLLTSNLKLRHELATAVHLFLQGAAPRSDVTGKRKKRV